MAYETGLLHRREVRTMFEPGRLGELYLADAYERLVPVVRREMHAAAAHLESKRQAMPQRQERQR